MKKAISSFISVVILIVVLLIVSILYYSWQTNYFLDITKDASNDTQKSIKTCSGETGTINIDIIEGDSITHFKDKKDYHNFDTDFGGGNSTTNISIGLGLNTSTMNATFSVEGSYL